MHALSIEHVLVLQSQFVIRCCKALNKGVPWAFVNVTPCVGGFATVIGDDTAE